MATFLSQKNIGIFFLCDNDCAFFKIHSCCHVYTYDHNKTWQFGWDKTRFCMIFEIQNSADLLVWMAIATFWSKQKNLASFWETMNMCASEKKKNTPSLSRKNTQVVLAMITHEIKSHCHVCTYDNDRTWHFLGTKTNIELFSMYQTKNAKMRLLDGDRYSFEPSKKGISFFFHNKRAWRQAIAAANFCGRYCVSSNARQRGRERARQREKERDKE